MPAEFEFQARLFAALEDYIEDNNTDFDNPGGRNQQIRERWIFSCHRPSESASPSR